MEDQPGELLPDRVHEGLEHDVALVLVGDQGIDLGEAAQVDALAEIVHLRQVLLPAGVDDLEEDVALERSHQLLAELFLALVVCGENVLGEQLGDLLAARGLRVELGEVDRNRPERAELGLEPVEVPLLEDVGGGVVADLGGDDAADLLARDIAHVAALENLAPVLVDDAALLVHDVVVLEDALPAQVVLLLDLLLRVLDLLAEHLRLERVLLALVVGRAEAVEDPVDPVAGEEPDQVVLGGQEEE